MSKMLFVGTFRLVWGVDQSMETYNRYFVHWCERV